MMMNNNYYRLQAISAGIIIIIITIIIAGLTSIIMSLLSKGWNGRFLQTFLSLWPCALPEASPLPTLDPVRVSILIEATVFI